MEILNGIITAIFWLGLLGLLGWGAWKVDRWGLKRNREKRDEQIEFDLRLAMDDSEAERRAARKILKERGAA